MVTFFVCFLVYCYGDEVACRS